MIVNQSKLCEILGMSPMTINRLQDQGFPVVSRGDGRKANQYDTAACVTWLVERERRKVATLPDGEVISLEAERTRLTKEQADKIEMENAVRRGEMVSADHVAALWANVLVNCKTRLLAIPTRAAPLVLGCKTMPQARDVIERFIFEALHDLSTSDATINQHQT